MAHETDALRRMPADIDPKASRVTMSAPETCAGLRGGASRRPARRSRLLREVRGCVAAGTGPAEVRSLTAAAAPRTSGTASPQAVGFAGG